MLRADIVIVGGGIVGLACAVALSKQTDLNIILLEAREPQFNWKAGEFALRVSAITPASKQFFQNLNVWPAIVNDRVAQYDNMFVWDGETHGEIHFNAAEVGEPCLGYIVENRVIVKALWEQLQAFSQVQIHCPAMLDTIKQNDDTLTLILQNGVRIKTPLLIAADGAHSCVREKMNIELKQRAYNHTAIVANVQCEKPHKNTARQRFSRMGPLALLPMSDPKVCSIVWSQIPEEAERLLALSPDAFNKEITQTFEACLGNINLCSERASFPLICRHVKNYVKPGVVLLGDAAHTIHPLAGQGVNLGLGDAQILSSTIQAAHAKKRNIAGAHTLRIFERTRKAEAVTLLAAMDGFKTLFASESPLLMQARAAGLGVVDRRFSLKNTFIRKAMGLY